MSNKWDFNNNQQRQIKFVRKAERVSFLKILVASVALVATIMFLISFANTLVVTLITDWKQQSVQEKLWVRLLTNFKSYWTDIYALVRESAKPESYSLLESKSRTYCWISLLASLFLTAVVAPILAYVTGSSLATRNLMPEVAAEEELLSQEAAERATLLKFIEELGNRLDVLRKGNQQSNFANNQLELDLSNKDKSKKEFDLLNSAV